MIGRDLDLFATIPATWRQRAAINMEKVTGAYMVLIVSHSGSIIYNIQYVIIILCDESEEAAASCASMVLTPLLILRHISFCICIYVCMYACMSVTLRNVNYCMRRMQLSAALLFTFAMCDDTWPFPAFQCLIHRSGWTARHDG